MSDSRLEVCILSQRLGGYDTLSNGVLQIVFSMPVLEGAEEMQVWGILSLCAYSHKH